MFSLFDSVENTVGKGENADYQHFLLFLQCFLKPPSLGSLKAGLCGKGLIKIPEICQAVINLYQHMINKTQKRLPFSTSLSYISNAWETFLFLILSSKAFTLTPLSSYSTDPGLKA